MWPPPTSCSAWGAERAERATPAWRTWAAAWLLGCSALAHASGAKVDEQAPSVAAQTQSAEGTLLNPVSLGRADEVRGRGLRNPFALDDTAFGPTQAIVTPGHKTDPVGGRQDKRLGQGLEQAASNLRDKASAVGERLAEGVASWYGGIFHGRLTANGERFSMHEFTAAHKTLPFGTQVRVRNLSNGKEVIVRINDRGPYAHGRIIDLSRAAAQELGIHGVGNVVLERVK